MISNALPAYKLMVDLFHRIFNDRKCKEPYASAVMVL